MSERVGRLSALPDDAQDALARASLESETLEEADAYRIAGVTRLTKEIDG